MVYLTVFRGIRRIVGRKFAFRVFYGGILQECLKEFMSIWPRVRRVSKRFRPCPFFTMLFGRASARVRCSSPSHKSVVDRRSTTVCFQRVAKVSVCVCVMFQCATNVFRQSSLEVSHTRVLHENDLQNSFAFFKNIFISVYTRTFWRKVWKPESCYRSVFISSVGSGERLPFCWY